MIPKIKIYKNIYSNPKFSYVAICVFTGSIFENEKEKGISHFLEHLIFKGSDYNDNIKILNNKLNGMGMHINAFTKEYITNFFITTPTIYIQDAINALIQILFNPLFRENDINNERKVVLNELIQRMNSPESIADITAQKLIYNKNNPLHSPVIGTTKTLLKITREDILNYYRKYYNPKNMIFFTSTALSEKTVKKMWIKSFEKYGEYKEGYINTSSTYDIFKSMIPSLSIYNRPQNKNLQKIFPNNEASYILINYVLPKIQNNDLLQLDIFSNYLAGSLSSVLFIILRENKQLIYSVSSSIDYSIDGCIFSIYFHCKKSKKIIDKCLKIVNNIINKSIKDGIPLKEFKKFKNKVLLNYQDIKSSGSYKIDRFLEKYIFNINTLNYEKVIGSSTNKKLGKIIKNTFKNAKKYTIIT